MKYSINVKSSAIAFAEYDTAHFKVTVSWKNHPNDYYHIWGITPRQIQNLEDSGGSLGQWVNHQQQNTLVTKE